MIWEEFRCTCEGNIGRHFLLRDRSFLFFFFVWRLARIDWIAWTGRYEGVVDLLWPKVKTFGACFIVIYSVDYGLICLSHASDPHYAL